MPTPGHRPGLSAALVRPRAWQSSGTIWPAVLDVTLRDLRVDTPWMSQLMAVHERATRLAVQRLDASLYQLIFTAGNGTEC